MRAFHCSAFLASPETTAATADRVKTGCDLAAATSAIGPATDGQSGEKEDDTADTAGLDDGPEKLIAIAGRGEGGEGPNKLLTAGGVGINCVDGPTVDSSREDGGAVGGGGMTDHCIMSVKALRWLD